MDKETQDKTLKTSEQGTMDSTLDSAAEATEQSELAPDLTEPVAWNAPEGLRMQRSLGWYVIFGTVVIALMALAILVFKSWTFAVLIPIMAISLIVLTDKTPNIINYAISPKGVYVADKLHDFSEFRAFGMIREGDHYSILLLPVKRFSPGLTIYFTEAEGERIVDMLGARLPMQEVKSDILEKFIHFIKL